ncbi:MAG: hypothetical protein E7477_08850 [Ruminococcaceae bacterium]|nr:hypothetical protein [Oscillospiraceae bacterium]
MAEDRSVDKIRRQINYLYLKHPNIHIIMRLPHHKRKSEIIPVIIKNVYPNLFVVTEKNNEHEELHTIMYTEILTNHIEVLELKNFK